MKIYAKTACHVWAQQAMILVGQAVQSNTVAINKLTQLISTTATVPVERFLVVEPISTKMQREDNYGIGYVSNFSLVVCFVFSMYYWYFHLSFHLSFIIIIFYLLSTTTMMILLRYQGHQPC